jgi:hypothetical protein
MTQHAENFDRLFQLAAIVGDESTSQQDYAELNSILLTDEECRRSFLEYNRMCVLLRMQSRAARAADNVRRRLNFEPSASCSDASGIPGSETLSSIPSGVVFHGTAGYLTSGWPVAYLIATLIFAVGMAIGGLVNVSQPGKLAVGPSKSRSDLLLPTSDPSVVGRVTGMVDCVFNHDESRIRNAESKMDSPPSSFVTQHSPLHLSDRLVLRSGLLELTYDTGARVILQGPVTYEVESLAGGYLAVGKLTARLEERSEVGGQKSELANQQSKIIDQKFFVRTPTAIVTDLGTEFGVEVDRRGDTTSQVFRGSVLLQPVAGNGNVPSDAQVLHENEAATVHDDAGKRIAAAVPAAQAGHFVREMPKSTSTRFDLADVVAGGDGFSGRRGRGINPATGLPTASTLAEPKNSDTTDCGRFRIATDGKYHRVKASPFVDGVFIPDGRSGGVQIDSTGHCFSDFVTVCNATAGNIWAGGEVPVPTSSMPPDVADLLPSLPPAQTLAPTRLGSVDYALPPHALIFLPANNGITFDLNAIRRANLGRDLLRFVATAGNTEIASENNLQTASADLWVFVDGQVRFRRREINKYSGAFPIALPIRRDDHFLTLVATDGGNDIGFDWIVFGDPVLELSKAAQEGRVNPPPKQQAEKRR